MFGTLPKEVILETLNNIKGGRLFKIGYRTELPVKAEYKNDGLKITKFTEKVVRTGVSYATLADSKQKVNIQKTLWYIHNKVKISNDIPIKFYACISNISNGNHKKVKYIIEWKSKNIFVTATDIEDSPYRNCIIDSYFNKKSSKVQTILFENIYKINNLEK